MNQVLYLPIQLPSGGISSSVGTAAGAGTQTGVGASVVAAVGTAVGTGSASGVGLATAASTGTQAGAGTQAATGASTAAAVGAAAGTGTQTGVGASTATAVGTAAGVGAAAATGRATTTAVGTQAGIGSASAVGLSTAASAGAASGAGTIAGVGTGINATVGAASGTGTAAAVGDSFALLYLRPDADDTDGGWTNELDSTTDLFASIDETSANDSDYIKSSENPAADICKIRLSNPVTGVGTPARVRYRYKKDGAGDVDLTVRLVQGTTQIAEWTHPGISASFVTTTQTLTQPEFDAITDFNDLFIELQADAA